MKAVELLRWAGAIAILIPWLFWYALASALESLACGANYLADACIYTSAKCANIDMEKIHHDNKE